MSRDMESNVLRNWDFQGSIIHFLRRHPGKFCGIDRPLNMLEILIRRSDVPGRGRKGNQGPHLCFVCCNQQRGKVFHANCCNLGKLL
jgi:hypothetical protein